MGKSTRWIKNVLLGKKSSNSSVPKGKERVLNEKEALVTAKMEEPDAVSGFPSIPNHVFNIADTSSGMLETDNIGAEKVSDNEIQVHEGQPIDLEGATPVPKEALVDEDKIQQENAATAIQAAFRGYLGRRAFWVLKGIIRLQALIRGHLVRRQAVAALCCVMGIVRLQALARGREVRHSDIGVDVHRKCRLQPPLESKLAEPVDTRTYLGIKKVASNTFVLKLLASSPKVTPLHFCYDSSDPNSISNWVENWSASRFWKPPVAQPKKISVGKAQKKFTNPQISEFEASQPKKSVCKVPAGNPTVQTSFESEKPRHNLRKAPSHESVELPAVGNPQSEFEKVKRSLRKVHHTVAENSIQPPMNPSDEETKEESMDAYSEKRKQEISEQPEVALESSSINHVEVKPLMVKETKDDKAPKPNSKESSGGKENQKSGKKGLVCAKPEFQESNGNQSSPIIPSYMQATQSAKAKLRLQASPRSAGQDGSEENNISRRHSLPSLVNGSRATSHSPRTARASNSGGKAESKNERPLLSSRQVKTTQVEWKR